MDLTAYLERIDYTGDLEPTLEVLRALHLAHLTHIPFSTIDALFFPPRPLNVANIEDKLIRQRGGGYCLEHHLMFAEVLEQIGFDVTMLVAKVHNGGPAIRPQSIPRPHLILAVALEGEQWLTDVTFGGGILLPVPIREGLEVDQFGWSYRMVRRDGVFFLQSWRIGEWLDLYSFTLEPKAFTDLLMLNHFARTHPDSGLLSLFWAHRADLKSRWTFWVHWLSGELRTVLIEYRVDGTMAEHPVDPEEFAFVLADRFGLHLPPDSRLPDQVPDTMVMAHQALDGNRS